MVQFHLLNGEEMDFSLYFHNHSGDETVCYKEVDGQKLFLSLYYPKQFRKDTKYPLFLMIHGGSWTSHGILPGQIQWCGDHLGFLARYYAEKGYVAASLDYRLLDRDGSNEKYELMDLWEDCADAVDYLQQHSDQYCLDLDYTVLLGESAGGYLAAALATFPWRRTISCKKLILVNSITTLLCSPWNSRIPLQSRHPALRNHSTLENSVLLSPLNHITNSTPDTLLLHGVEDKIVSLMHSFGFYEEMHQRNRNVQLHLLEKTGHAFLLAEYKQSQGSTLLAATKAIQLIDQWLAESGE